MNSRRSRATSTTKRTKSEWLQTSKSENSQRLTRFHSGTRSLAAWLLTPGGSGSVSVPDPSHPREVEERGWDAWERASCPPDSTAENVSLHTPVTPNLRPNEVPTRRDLYSKNAPGKTGYIP